MSLYATVSGAHEQTGELNVSISGRLTIDTVDEVMADMRIRIAELPPQGITVDLAGIEYLDSAGAMVLLYLQQAMEARSISCRLINLSKESENIMALLNKAALTASPLPLGQPSLGIIRRIGQASLAARDGAVMLMTFLGGIVIALARCLVHPQSIRWKDVLHSMERVGVEGLPIISIISLLVGLIIAFMSSLQLKPLGGNLFIASLVGIAVVKELGPLMTAIIVAGRSGSAFAAEIGTMAVNEELDALVTMGFDPMEFLVVPKVLATVMVVPLLVFYADFFGILGGLIVGVMGMDLTVGSYINQTAVSLSLADVTMGLAKSIVFAALISGIGCHRGLLVKRAAEGVGVATTSAVVSAIFLIVVADSIFAILYHYIG